MQCPNKYESNHTTAGTPNAAARGSLSKGAASKQGTPHGLPKHASTPYCCETRGPTNARGPLGGDTSFTHAPPLTSSVSSSSSSSPGARPGLHGSTTRVRDTVQRRGRTTQRKHERDARECQKKPARITHTHKSQHAWDPPRLHPRACTHQLVSTVIAKSTVRVAVHEEGGVKGKGEEDTSSTQHALSPENIGMEGI